MTVVISLYEDWETLINSNLTVAKYIYMRDFSKTLCILKMYMTKNSYFLF